METIVTLVHVFFRTKDALSEKSYHSFLHSSCCLFRAGQHASDTVRVHAGSPGRTVQKATTQRTPETSNPPAKHATVPLRIGGGIKIPAGGAPAGSRLAAMVGDEDYYRQLSNKDDNPEGRGG
jgi:hypothetical protein